MADGDAVAAEDLLFKLSQKVDSIAERLGDIEAAIKEQRIDAAGLQQRVETLEAFAVNQVLQRDLRLENDPRETLHLWRAGTPQ